MTLVKTTICAHLNNVIKIEISGGPTEVLVNWSHKTV